MGVMTGRVAQGKRECSADSTPRVVVKPSDGRDLNHEIRRSDREVWEGGTAGRRGGETARRRCLHFRREPLRDVIAERQRGGEARGDGVEDVDGVLTLDEQRVLD